MRIIFCLALTAIFLSCTNTKDFYTADDFIHVPKTDAHFHYLTTDLRFSDFADSLNFTLISPNVDTDVPVDTQWYVSKEVMKHSGNKVKFLCTFTLDGFGEDSWADSVISTIDRRMAMGAYGVKIWKNIGMELRNKEGSYVMASDPAFEPVFRHIQEKSYPLLAHLGEPRNCWLPEEEMTDSGDRAYYRQHPQYHMYLHPEMPSYEEQIEARDRLLERYPGITFIGAHLGSLEWSVDELAIRLDLYPNFSVDMSARMGHLRNQSAMDYEKVRAFLITYQDRLLYGTDMSVYDELLLDSDKLKKGVYSGWMNDWLYLATDSTVRGIKGMNLPRQAVDKIMNDNAKRLYNLPEN